MALDPRIPLGVQPVQTQQPNMLAQYAQIMGIKAAQQEMQGNNEMRELFAGGANFDDPEFQRRGYMANAKGFQDLLGKRATTQKTEMEALGKEIELRRDALTNARTPEDYLKWHDGNNQGKLGAFLKSIGMTPSRESIVAQLNQPGGLEKLKTESALGATRLAQELYNTKRSQIAAGPGNRQAALSERQYEDKLKYGGDLVTTTIPDPENPKQRIEIQTRRDLRTGQLIPLEVAPMPMRIDISPSSATSSYQPSGGGAPNVNALAPQAAPAPNVNALNPNAPQQQGPVFAMPKSTTAPTLTEVDDPANPGQKLRVDARIYKQGGTIGDPGVLGVARTENLTPAQKQKLKGEMSKDFEALQRVVGQTNELLESIDAVRSSSLEKVAGPVDARTPSLFKEAQVADARFNNLKGKVTAIAKANASLGGAIGSIANQEWQILANQIAVLDLAGGATANLEQIEQLERQAMSIVSRMRDGFERQYGADVETLAPQYKDVPNVNYTPGQYTATGKKNSSVDSTNPWLK